MGKNLWHQRKGTLTEDWKEISKETCVCNVCLQVLSYKKTGVWGFTCLNTYNTIFRCKTHNSSEII